MARKEIVPRLEFNIKLNGDKWIVRLYSHKNFIKIWGHCMAVTWYSHKTGDLSINFRGPYVSKDTVAHELIHAYFSYKNVHKHCLPETVEEKMAEMFGKKHQIIYLLTKKVHAILKRRRRKKGAKC